MAAGATYEPIATTTLSSAASSITFSSISSTYTDLRVVIVANSSTAAGVVYKLTFNSDTGTNYSNTLLAGDGTNAYSSRATSTAYIDCGTTGSNTSAPSFIITDVFSYAGSTYKTVLNNQSRDQNGSGDTINTVGLWRSTSAITSITYTTSAGNFKAGTTATLYGIKAA